MGLSVLLCHPSSSSSSSCERPWLEERAELGSRWTWLQLRLAELEGRIQRMVELHKHIRSTKGGVVLAESQPLTDRQIQQTLLSEMAGLSCTASDADMEPCSPTRLLHNIERQVGGATGHAHLEYRGNTTRDTNGQKGVSLFEPGSSTRRRLEARRLSRANVSCVCARTRPLVTYHKPKLFTIKSCNPSSPQVGTHAVSFISFLGCFAAPLGPDSGKPSSTTSSSLSSSSCSCCSSCDPVDLCSDPDCSSNTPLRVQAREEWSQRPLLISVQPSSQTHYKRRSSTPLHNSKKLPFAGHTHKQHARRHKRSVLGLSPIRRAGSAQSQCRRANQRKRKRRHIHRLTEDEEEVLYQFCDPNSSDEVMEESYSRFSRKKASQGFARKRQGESVYNINNIVIPMSLAKVEKLQYKDILTPSWRGIDTSPLVDSETEKKDDDEEEKEEEKEEDEEQVEDLSNTVFAQRHLDVEKREKLRWSSWGKRKCCRLPERSGSRLSGSGGGVCTSGEESSMELGCAQLDSGEQQSSEEWLPQTPWEPRVFPLDEDEEEALLSDDLDKVPSGWPEFGSACSTSKNYNSCLSLASSRGATLPPGGQCSTSHGS
ncbi:KAT8 regulatory NSL complex subunit 1-like protein [Liparis tanakae]|uniref:KAT8 regulatory NSL complex subunit 1-like protein n=1 Tax=Liparis tanakae TaxID=230148 RepID=A0A4Z2IIA1_9TELE|nr:KAT8 regulatory NSL complex subunit 1-like protein [Liparis tanakae]